MKNSDESPDPLELRNEAGESVEITHIPEAALGKELGRLMYNMRRRAKLRRADIAQRLGITSKEVRKLERGIPADNLPFVTTVLFARACGCTFEMHIRARKGSEAGKETVFEF